MVLEGCLDCDGALYLAGDAPRVPYGEMVNASLLARLVAWSKGGARGPRPPLVWEESDVCVLRGRLFLPPLEIPSQGDERMWKGVG